MKLQKPTAVIFDMDGTTVRHLNPLFLDILEKLDDFSFKARKLISSAFPFGKAKEIKPRRRYSPKMIVHTTIHRFRRKPVEQIVEPCPGIYDVLEFFTKRKIPLGLVSNSLGRGYGHDILETFHMKKYFQEMLFAEDINKSKPDPEPITQMTSLLIPEISENDVIWYVGDRHKDIQAARNARNILSCTVEPVAYSLFSSGFIAILENNLGTERIFATYDDMHKKLKTLFAP